MICTFYLHELDRLTFLNLTHSIRRLIHSLPTRHFNPSPFAPHLHGFNFTSDLI